MYCGNFKHLAKDEIRKLIILLKNIDNKAHEYKKMYIFNEEKVWGWNYKKWYN
jgi:hypothetical protein